MESLNMFLYRSYFLFIDRFIESLICYWFFFFSFLFLVRPIQTQCVCFQQEIYNAWLSLFTKLAVIDNLNQLIHENCIKMIFLF